MPSRGNIEETSTVLEASFAVSLGNVERNRLGCSQPLIAGVPVKSG